MSLADRLLALVIAVLVAFGAGWVWRGNHEATKRAQEALKSVQATSVSHARKSSTLARSKALADRSLESTLAQVPEWRDTPVPKEVQDDLCSIVDCLPAGASSDSLRRSADGSAGAASAPMP